MSMRRYLIACGGTGGHLSPGIAVAEELIRRGHSPRLLISRKEVDGRLAQKYRHLDFCEIPGTPFGLSPITLARFGGSQLRALWTNWSLMRRERPDAVLAFGGFTTLGSILGARLHGIPTAVHEANRHPGRAVYHLRHVPDRLYLPDGVRLPGVSQGVIRHYGYPVRREIRRMPKDEARRALGIDVTGKLLLIFGGSQGAQSLNDWARENMQRLGAEGISIYCITGLGKGSDGVFEVARKGSAKVRAKAWFVSFSDRIGEVLSAADLAVSRAGAGSLAEMSHCLLPSILIPYPFAADNHQEANARYLERQGGGILLAQNQLQGLFDEVRDVLFNDWLLSQFHKNLEAVRRPQSGSWIAEDLETLQRNPEPLAPRRKRFAAAPAETARNTP
jgi:UDP-N-acetylglucosamine--N-acetylmuramyl-(pentapeptide) pyrophosphoryl-undecaprenol N-acetylglucosamine transferase